METFTYTGLPARVVFGFGTIDQLFDETDNLGIKRALVLTTPQQREAGDRVAAHLGDRAAGLFAEAAMHTPVEVTGRALAQYDAINADGVVAIGGGSTIGLGKAIALRNETPQIVLPTTYAGSEMTSIIGQTEDGVKTTQKTSKVLPETVIYDVNLTRSLPAKMSVTSGVNAMAHAVEALYAENANPVLSQFAENGVRSLANALPEIVRDPESDAARYQALYGAWMCGVCLGSSGVALHHKLCHVLGGSFDLPHAETHTVVLPHALTYNAPAIGEALDALKRALNSETPAGALFDLAKTSGVPTSLRELGMPEAGIERAVEITFENPYWNPRPFDRDGVFDLIKNAWSGIRPQC